MPTFAETTVHQSNTWSISKAYKAFLYGGTILASSVILVSGAQALNWTGLGGDQNWNTIGNWSTVVPDGNTAAAVLSGAGLAGQISLQGTTRTVNTLSITDPFNIDDGTLIFDGAGAAASFVTNLNPTSLNSSVAVQLASDTEFVAGAAATVASGISAVGGAQTLTIGGASTGSLTLSGALTDGAGTLALNVQSASGTVLTGANNFSGGTTVANGAQLNSSGTLAGSIDNSGTLSVNAGTAGTVSNSATGTLTILAPASTGAVTNSGTGSSAGTIAALTNDAGSFTNTGTVSGVTDVNAGVDCH